MKIAKKISSIILLLFVPALLIQLGVRSGIFHNISEIVQSHVPIYLFVLFLLKTVSIVYPPLPGVVLTIASIPLVGWKLAYFVDILGSFVGATISFYLGKKYGFSLLKLAVGKKLADKVLKIKLKQKTQVEAAIFLRIASGGMLSDGLAWGASLIGFRYVSFILGYLISHILTTLPVFYLIAASIVFDSWIVVFVIAILAWLILYKLKGRYFE